jgi:hypothetical protein
MHVYIRKPPAIRHGLSTALDKANWMIHFHVICRMDCPVGNSPYTVPVAVLEPDLARNMLHLLGRQHSIATNWWFNKLRK